MIARKEHYGPDAYRAVLEVQREMDRRVRSDDPRFHRHVLVVHEEGTTLYFRSAFLLILDEWVLIFTEHHGSHVYHQSDLLLYKQFVGGEYIGDHYDLPRVETLFTSWFQKLKNVKRIGDARKDRRLNRKKLKK